jgi:pimeloyl-ACP methyl ester carboxylesterase
MSKIFGILVAIVIVLGVQEVSAKEPVKQGTANVNGTTLYYEIKGRGFPLVFISGGGILDRRCWDEQFEVFAKKFRVIRYDVRGIGKSARPVSTFSHSQDLYDLLTFLKIKRAHVAGLSVGSAIAIDFGIEHPEIVDHLILGAPGLSNDSKAEANLQSLATISSLAKAKGLDQVIQLTLDQPFVLSKENAPARRVRQIYLDNRDVFDSGFPLYVLWQPTQPSAEARLGEIRARVLIVRGDKDSPGYSALTEKISRGIKEATTVVIPGGTHFLNLEKPLEFNEAVMRFLQ